MLKKHIKSFAKKIYSFLDRKRAEIRVFKIAKSHLKKGIYYFPSGTKKIKKLDRKIVSAFFNIFHIYVNLSGNGSLDFLEWGIGEGKVVLLEKEEAYGFFFKRDGYLFSKKNYLNYYEKFNYPCMSVISYNDDLKSIKMQKVYGKIYNDKKHNDIVVNKMIDLAIDADVIFDSENNALFLQHGDANPYNVIWQNETDFLFIDIDNLHYYPPLLDVFHYMSCCSCTLDEIVEVLNKNKKAVEKIARRAGINVEESLFDNLFYRYVYHYKKLNICFEDFKFLNIQNTSNYPKTNELLRSKL